MRNRLVICLASPLDTPAIRDSLRALELAAELRFVGDLLTPPAVDGYIACDSDAPDATAGPSPFAAVRLLVATSDTRHGSPTHISDLAFTSDPEVPWPYRGRTVPCRMPASCVPLRLHQGERALATTADGPVWTVAEDRGTHVYRSAFALPLLSDDGIARVVDGEGLPATLPLLHFYRRAAGRRGYELPPLRASFIIDDPNLHWPRYGFADYRSIAVDAEIENYHVGFATIPLDTWFTHSGSADIFRSHPRRLSLLIHGNNHGRNELAVRMSVHESAQLLRQAVSRIAALEERAGLRVCRVMVPPHGACSAQMLAQMPRHGFESACISTGSLRAHNPDEAWAQRIGVAPVELVEDCPVHPRWAFTGTSEPTLLAAAYLGRPLILRGHHQDLREGLDLFRQHARLINSLGPVQWGDLQQLGRTSYLASSEGRSLVVKPLGTKLQVRIPAETDRLIVEDDRYTWRSIDAAASKAAMPTGLQQTVRPGDTVAIERVQAVAPTAFPSRHSRTAFPLLVRRLLTETRDRLLSA